MVASELRRQVPGLELESEQVCCSLATELLKCHSRAQSTSRETDAKPKQNTAQSAYGDTGAAVIVQRLKGHSNRVHSKDPPHRLRKERLKVRSTA